MKEKIGDKRKEEVFRLKEKAKGKEARKGNSSGIKYQAIEGTLARM